MRVFPFMVAAAALLASQAQAAPRDVRAYLERAGEAAASQVAAAGVDVGDGLDIMARVDADGRLTSVRVLKSTGSLQTDLQALKALKRLRVPGPPNALLGADVTVAVAKTPILAAEH